MIAWFIGRSLLINLCSVIITLLLPTIILVTLPGEIIDAFIFFSFIMSALLLVIMLENDQPLKVTFLPTVVLLLTTFRLLLSIATTRNIIANENVGHVIETVGKFVMGGNLISGLLIFIIITIVQFLVVTKGGERVAEVAARFSLDALPGKQMSIDGDLKSGLISGVQAQKLRSDLNIENKLFGSLDGAMKFIKGDAIAGILISLVNLFGGIYVGINQFDFSLLESISRFSVLTIGDGLVSQIPSLLLSIACGVYLTRIKGSIENSTPFIEQLMLQVCIFWKNLLIFGLIIFTLGLFKSNMVYICTPIALLCVLTAFILRSKQSSFEETTVVEPFGSGIFQTLKFVIREESHLHIIHRNIDGIEQLLWGQPLGTPAIKINDKLDNDLEVYISNICIFHFNHDSSGKVIEVMKDDVFIRNQDVILNVSTIVNYFLRNHLVDKYNLQYTSNIINDLAVQSEVMKNEIDAAIGLNRIHDVLKEMIGSAEFYLDKISFFEALIYWSRVESEPKNWFTRIRSKARYEITSRLLYNHDKLHVVIFDPQLTELIKSFVMGEVENIDQLIHVRESLRDDLVRLTKKYGYKPIVIVDDTEVNLVKSFCQHVMSTVVVCSYNDITDHSYISTSEQLEIKTMER